MKTKLPCGCEVDLEDKVSILNHLVKHQQPPPEAIRLITKYERGITWDAWRKQFGKKS